MGAKRVKATPRLRRRYAELPVAIDLLLNRRIAFLSPSLWDDRNDSHFIRKYQEEKAASAVLAICHSSIGETYHHWRVFCRHSSGVCIEFFRDELIAFAKKMPGVRSGRVKYRTLGKIEDEPQAAAFKPMIAELEKLAKRYFLLLGGADNLALRVSLDQKTGEVAAEATLTPKPNTELAKQIAARKPAENRFAGLLGKDTVAALYYTAPLFAEEIREGYSKLTEEQAKEIAANLPDVIAIRDSKRPDDGAHVVDRAAFTAFIADAKAGRYDG